MHVQVSVDNYQEWIQLVAQYTVQSLKAWQWASGSIHYLLGLWSRLVSSAAYLKGDAPSLLDTYAPRIIEAYLSSRYVAFRLAWWGHSENIEQHCGRVTGSRLPKSGAHPSDLSGATSL